MGFAEFLGFLFSLSHDHVLKIAEVFRAGFIALLRRHLAIQVPQFRSGRQCGTKPEVRVAMLRAPDDCLRAENARDHDWRMWLLIRPYTWIDEAVVEVFAFPAKRTGPRPRRQDQIMRLVEHLAVVSRVGVIEDLLAAGPTHPSGNQAPMRDTVDRREFFRDAQRVLERRQRIAEQDDAG